MKRLPGLFPTIVFAVASSFCLAQDPVPTTELEILTGGAGFAKRIDLGTGPQVFFHTGTLSPAAAAGITAAGWKTVSVSYPSR